MQLNLSTALKLLDSFRIPFSVGEGISYLEQCYYDTNLLFLYRNNFPLQWQRSQLPETERALEFLELVGENLFPIHDAEDMLDYYHNTGGIYLISENIDWWQYSIDEFGLGVQLLLSLMGEGHALDEEWKEHFGFIPEERASLDYLGWERLKYLSKEQPLPLSFLYSAVSLIDCSTGCIWLDTAEEEYDCSFALTQETLLALAQEWQVARQYLSQMQEFEAWLQSSVVARQQVVKLWNLAQNNV